MCSEFKTKTKLNEVEATIGESIESNASESSWDRTVKFTNSAPVLVKKKGVLTLEEMIFPAQPFPNSRLSQLKEDQIVRIYDVPIWKTGFHQHPCLVPMTSFMEPAYWGPRRGEIVEFSPPASDKMFFVPGLVIKPRVPATGKFNGFSLLTHTASEQMLEFHHRQLVMLKPQQALEYLEMQDANPEERFNFLVENRYLPTFNVEKERNMAKGWEKRVDQHVEALNEEKHYRSALSKEHVRG